MRTLFSSFFHVLQLLPITRRKLCYISQIYDKTSTISGPPPIQLWLLEGHGFEHIGPPNRVPYRVWSALYMIFSVTYYLEVHNAISIYCISCDLPNKMLHMLVGHSRTLITLLRLKKTSRVKKI